MLKGASHGLGTRSILADLGNSDNYAVEIELDSSAAKAMAQRRGLGKTRHVATRYLWLQQKQAQNEVKLTKIRGTDNDADILTKHVDEGTMNKMLEQMSFEYRHGRSAAATRSLRIKT